MSARLSSHAEAAKLARLLGVTEPDALAFVRDVPAEELRRYREEVTDVLFDGDRLAFQRIADAARLVPARTAAHIGERVLGPLICARVTGLVEPSRAGEIAGHLSIAFLAALAAELDPRRAVDVITNCAPVTVGEVAAVMAARGEHVAMGRFVGHLDRAALMECVTRLQDDDLLRVAVVLDEWDHLDTVVELVGEERTTRLVARADTLGLSEEAAELLTRLDAPQRTRICGAAEAGPG